AGKIRAFGHSTFPAEMIVEAQWVASTRGHVRPRSEQPPYSILVRRIERDVLPTCQQYGIGVLTWSPLAGGWLAGRFGSGKKNTSRRSDRLPARYDLTVPANQRKLEAVDRLQALADEAGLSLIDLALGVALEHPAVTSVIIGPRTKKHLESQLGAPERRLSPDLLDRIDEVVAPGTNVNPGDGGWDPPALSPAQRRRPSA
ncbi:MAG: aldo/keto reductase, partial [Acidobacteriota bacterium]|nr:aldo/keto reductase [Acidobacteriota bacterium]